MRTQGSEVNDLRVQPWKGAIALLGRCKDRRDKLQWRELGYARSDRKELSTDSLASRLDFCVISVSESSCKYLN